MPSLRDARILAAAQVLGEAIQSRNALAIKALQDLQRVVDNFQALQPRGNSAPPASIRSDTHPFSKALSSLPHDGQDSPTTTPNSPAPSPNGPLDLIQHLSQQSTEIKSYLSSTKPVEFCHVPKWMDDDPRVVDVLFDTGCRSRTSKFRAGLARRSLAFSFHRWQIETHGASRVNELANDLSAAQTRQDGHIKQYLDANGNRFQNRPAATDGIVLGTKYLVFELLLHIKSISAILIFEHNRFRRIQYGKLSNLKDLVSGTSWIMELAK